jgi:hypothetical protein
MAKVSSTEEWSDAIIKHIKKLTDSDEKYEFAHTLILDLALWTGYNTYEMIGLLEVVKDDLMNRLKEFADDDECDCPECQKRRGEIDENGLTTNKDEE